METGTASRLPYVDELSVEVAADGEAVWEALLTVVERSFASARTEKLARILGCANVEPSGPWPPAAGSTLPGFQVEAAAPTRELALAGSHRFSKYALIFRLDELGDGRTHLRAETRADFPGVKGGVYRTLVIGTGGHVLITRRLLDAIKRRAERS